MKSVTPKQGDLRSPYHEEPGVGVGGGLKPIGYVMELSRSVRRSGYMEEPNMEGRQR